MKCFPALRANSASLLTRSEGFLGVEPEGGVAVGAGVLPAAPPPPITIQFSYIRNHITYDVGQILLHFLF